MNASSARQYLLQAIESRRHCVNLSDQDLTKLLSDVQRSRDDRSLLLDSLERLLLDLRSQSHATAFLARVSKRDAPDYYDVIKNPMDLGLMLKNVKSGKYRSKEGFRKDLDLIWDNCLLYNSEPVSTRWEEVLESVQTDRQIISLLLYYRQSHPLRYSANWMRKRSRDLLSYIQDSNDVKSALADWVATHTSLSTAEVKALQNQSSREAISNSVGLASLGSGASLGYLAAAASNANTPASSSTMGPSAALNREDSEPIAGPSTRGGSKRTNLVDLSHANAEEPFENRSALTAGTSAALADYAVEDRRTGERDEWALKGLLGQGWDEDLDQSMSQRALGKRKVVQPIFEADDEDQVVGQMLRSLTSGQPVSVCGPLSELPSTATARLPRLIPASSTPVHEPLIPAERPRPKRPQLNGHAKLNGDASPGSSSTTPTETTAPPKRKRGVAGLRRNMQTLGKMKKLKYKFDCLDYCLENEQPLPSSLLLESDDEESGEIQAGDVAVKKEDKHAPAGLPHRRSTMDPEGAVSSAPPQPYPTLSLPQARSALFSRMSLLLGSTGFDACHMRPARVLTSLLETFISSMGRTLRLYMDRYGSTMSPEEIVLHVLHATSNTTVSDLDRYLHEDTPRYASRLEETHRKLAHSWKERIALGQEKLQTEEDARFFGESNEDLMAGNIPGALEDDFFGFKAMGLDQELGLADLNIPPSLLQARGGARGAGAIGLRAGLANRKVILGPNGLPIEGRDLEGPDTEQLPFPPPEPFIRLSEAAVPAQIGLLRNYFRDLLHRRGHRGGTSNGDGQNVEREGRRGSRKRRRRNNDDDDDEEDEHDDDEDDEDEDEEEDDLLALSDEEQERSSRYKVPPTGKMPRREFWVETGQASSSNASKKASTTASSGSGTKVTATSGKAAAATGTGAGKGKKKGKKD